MKTNYDSLKEHNETLSRLCISADALVKTFPEKAAVLYGKAVNSFLSVICSDNDIAFDRVNDLTPINMIGTAYSCGVISKYEKGVLDDMRYSAYLAKKPASGAKPLDTRTLIDKIINFYGMVMRYYHLEDEHYSEDVLPIGSHGIIKITKSFELDTAFDRVYLTTTTDDGADGYGVIAQYARGRSDFADEVFSLLEKGPLKLKVPKKSAIKPEVVPHSRGNNIICVKSVIPRGFVKFSFDDFLPLMPEQRIKFIVNLACAIYELHVSGLSLSGFAPSDIWVSFKSLGCIFSGLESRIGSPFGTQKSIARDVKCFAALVAVLFPEYDKIPVAGLTVKHALMGSGKVSMEQVYKTLKKEALKRSYEAIPLSALSSCSLSEEFTKISESILPPDATAGSVITDSVTEDFSEMYSKIFG